MMAIFLRSFLSCTDVHSCFGLILNIRRDSLPDNPGLLRPLRKLPFNCNSSNKLLNYVQMRKTLTTSMLAYSHSFRCAPSWQMFDALASAYPTAWSWQGRDESDLWLGLGVFRTTESLQSAREVLRILPVKGSTDPGIRPRAFAIFPFDLQSVEKGPWSSFYAPLVALPKCSVCFRQGVATLFRLCEKDEAPDLQADEAIIREAAAAPTTTLPHAINFGRDFGQEAWIKAVGELQSAMNAGLVSKVVLARSTWREGTRRWPSGPILNYMSTLPQSQYVFAHRFREDSFLGASPEQLFKLSDGTLETESLAGTRPRSADPDCDRRMHNELVTSPKENSEQTIVTNFVIRQMEKLCDSVATDSAPSVRRLATVQHLRSRILGTLRSGKSLDDILEALHPTPAVCGAPREPARELISRLETAARGLYAGAIGWLDAENAEFAVAIRSALLRDNRAYVFAGAGMVPDSDPLAEWNETVLKMKPMLAALGCEKL